MKRIFAFVAGAAFIITLSSAVQGRAWLALFSMAIFLVCLFCSSDTRKERGNGG